jgi:integrase
MTPKRHLTDRTLKALAPAKPGERYEIRDSLVSGFRVRVNDERDPSRPGKAGHISGVMYARFPGSKARDGSQHGRGRTEPIAPTRRALGRYGELTLEQLRDKAAQWRKLIDKGIDPAIEEEHIRLAEQRKRANTFAVVAEDFIRDKVSTERAGRAVTGDIRREFISVWGNRPITEITPHDVLAVIKPVAARGARYQAHNLYTTVKRLFGWAIDQHVYGLESSPCDRLRRKSFIAPKTPRSRIFTDREWRAFWNATGAMPYPYGPLFRVLALTGQRRTEVAEARWCEIDFAAKLWSIPPQRMKSAAAHVVPLTAPVVAILESLPRFDGGDYLFTSTHGRKPISGFNRAKCALDSKMLAELGELPPFVLHDVRRSMRTGLSALPVPDLIRELVIGHTKPGLHKIYDQYAHIDAKRDALQLWRGRLQAIVEPPPGNVVAIKRVAG